MPWLLLHKIFALLSGNLKYEIINTSRGFKLIMIDKYTFNKNSKHTCVWVCSSKMAKQCTAKIHLNSLNEITYYDLEHNHKPPNYVRCKQGYFIKL